MEIGEVDKDKEETGDDRGYDAEHAEQAEEGILVQHHHPYLLQGVGIRVHGSGFGVQGLGFRVQCSGSRVQGSGFSVQCSVFGVEDKGSGFTV